MNRREAMAALIALPAASHIVTVPGGSDDVIVLETEEHLSAAMCEELKRRLEGVWPSRQVIVLGSGLRVKLVAK